VLNAQQVFKLLGVSVGARVIFLCTATLRVALLATLLMIALRLSTTGRILRPRRQRWATRLLL
jgi:hypothetical protein